MADPRIEAAVDAAWANTVQFQSGETFAQYNERDPYAAGEFLVSIIAAIAAADAVAWRPIESAPRDGAQVLLFRPKAETSTQRITAGAWYEPEPVLIHMCPDMGENDMPDPHWESWDGGFPADNLQPTHWQPLPTPPNATPQAAPDTITIPEVRTDRPILGKDGADG